MDAVEKEWIKRNRRDALRRAGIVAGVEDAALVSKKLKDYRKAVYKRAQTENSK